MTSLIIFGVLLELIIIIVIIYVILKLFHKITKPVPPEKVEVNPTEIKNPEGLYSTSPKDEPVRKSGGNLIPYGLSQNEKRILEMFYSD